ncbi:RimK/LysX family protein [Kamptonema cortianum]|nr:RimK/LysX family protein [Geitlerinema splendidum]MDK3155920.1 RimK/LysX family protein [Kamptonema cortianum]
MASDLVVVGYLERVKLPDWGIDSIIAKLDTGAKTSTIHAENIEETEDGHVNFDLILRRKGKNPIVPVNAKVVRKTSVRPSTGKAQNRYVVSTRVVMGGIEKEIEVTLSSRKRMKRRMLLGRQALAGTFLVDAGQVHVL